MNCKLFNLVKIADTIKEVNEFVKGKSVEKIKLVSPDILAVWWYEPCNQERTLLPKGTKCLSEE